MPRGPRLDAPGVFHHVWARGIERRKIFLNDEDREDFLQRLTIGCHGGAAFVYAWSLLDNHLHIAIRTGKASLSTVMRRVMTGYAAGFNRKRKRSGHLFQNRYGSTIVDEETYFLRLVRYIHLNPLWAGMVKDLRALARYKWTGHAVLMGNAEREFQVTDEVLGRFAPQAGAARKALVAFMSEKDVREDKRTFGGGGLKRSIGLKTGQPASRRMGERQIYDERVLGGGEFVEQVLRQIEGEEQRPLWDTRLAGERLLRLMNKVCNSQQVQVEELVGGSRRRQLVRIREALCYLAVKRLGLSGAETARLLGVRAHSARRSAEAGLESLKRLGLNEKELLD